ncbi:sec-independent protein translocase protein TatB [Propionibacterium cyclohexanicum]|uniref:Sec-independent protein translocase protein TatB n=1 Tax=Propionibacterium cyclohexanicum TaxID=64702 RepID=A0A1H9PFS6_9ACTN|nr:sec-independent translocase [Propionibacterium cyclohexanicum]SER47146.1 sec-independent protein translocase protein TatB [Propionibacterium cyclohexanicum]
MVPLVFGINAGEFIILLALAVIMFGPERIPEFSRKAARIVYYLRKVANDATHQLKDELGPEYKDLTIQDLNPRTFVQKHVLDGFQEDINDIENQLDTVKSELNAATADVEQATTQLNESAHAQLVAEPEPLSASEAMRQRYGVCFDLEAT